MKIINREIGYAIKALCYLYQEKDIIVTTGYLATYFEMSRPFLRKILQKLNQVGILDSYKGKRGGFKLAIPAEQIYLIDLIEVFQGPIQMSGCYRKGQECPLIRECPVRFEIEKLEKRFIDDLAKISLKTIIDKQKIKQNQKN